MARYYGIECKTCGGTIALGKCDKKTGKFATFYAVPRDAVPCRACGSNYLYDSDDLFEFEGADDIPVFGQGEKPR